MMWFKVSGYCKPECTFNLSSAQSLLETLCSKGREGILQYRKLSVNYEQNNKYFSCIELKALLNSNSTIDCPKQCETCWNNLTCASCPVGTYLWNGQCYDKCPSGTYLTESRQCFPCNKNCLECNDHKSCTKCNNNQYVWQNTCWQQCPQGTYLFSNISCEPCDQSCKECNGNGNTSCIACASNQVLYQHHCIAVCPVGMVQSLNICISCEITCNRCDSLNTSLCIVCQDDYYLWEKKCWQECPESTLPTIQVNGQRTCVLQDTYNRSDKNQIDQSLNLTSNEMFSSTSEALSSEKTILYAFLIMTVVGAVICLTMNFFRRLFRRLQGQTIQTATTTINRILYEENVQINNSDINSTYNYTAEHIGTQQVVQNKRKKFVQIDISQDCAICLEPKSIPGFDIVPLSLNKCGHYFHAHCLQEWKQPICPICRFVGRPAMQVVFVVQNPLNQIDQTGS